MTASLEKGNTIRLSGVRVHNLQSIDVEIPLRKLTVVTGVSGAGKTSLALGTLYAEANRRYVQSLSPYTRQFLERVQKPDAERIDPLPPAIAVNEQALTRGQRATVGTMSEILDYLRLLLVRAGSIVCVGCGQNVRPQSSGDVVEAVRNLPPQTRFAVAFPTKSGGASPEETTQRLREDGLLRVQVAGETYKLDELKPELLQNTTSLWVLVDRLVAGNVKPERLIDSVETTFRFGKGRLGLLLEDEELLFDETTVCPRCEIEYPPLEPRLLDFNSPLGACPVCSGTGVVKNKSTTTTCAECQGTRLNDQAKVVRLDGVDLAALSNKNVHELADWCANVSIPESVAQQSALLLGQITDRLKYLQRMKVGHLTLDRVARSLSVGESKRVRLATAIGSNLVNALYILDELLTGLHESEIPDVLDSFHELVLRGNTVLVVGHHPAVILAADWLIDIGPGAGEEGGRICYQGPVAGLYQARESVTARCLAKPPEAPTKKHKTFGRLSLSGKIINRFAKSPLEIPLGVLCVITGPSGSGKTTLLERILHPNVYQRLHGKLPTGTDHLEVNVKGAEQLGEVLLMDQTPIQKTARSNPVTYIKVFDGIRELFAESNESKVRDFNAGTFSFNQPGGRCDACDGQGVLNVDMQFLADITMECPDCKGRRYKKEVLDVVVAGLNIAEVLNLTVREGFRFFRGQNAIQKKLKMLSGVGLDYLRLGQPLDTVSGGEAQRLRLASHLASSRKSRCLFLLDEPTSGLHPADVAKLLECFDRILETGHSVVVGENNRDVLNAADHVIELGGK
ncbi:MAG: ABC-ATPase UvrA [Gemmataceae bacterium]